MEKETRAKLENKKFKPTLNKEFQWSTWAIARDKSGKIDFNKTLTGPDLKKFVDDKLFPYLSSFRNTAENFDTIEYNDLAPLIIIFGILFFLQIS